MHHVLVTGGAGFIGSNFVRYLLSHDPSIEIVTLDALTYAGSLENLKDLPGEERRHTFVHGDICDRPLVDRLLQDHAIGTIAHFAAESHVDRSILGPAPFVQTNIVGTFTLLEAARSAWQQAGQPAKSPRFLHVSTDEVFGSLGPDDPPFAETTPYAPNSPYAASKAASDHLVRSYVHTYGFPAIITNCSNNYGPYQFPEKLIPLMISNALQGRPLPVYGDGGQIRDWLYVEDHCQALHTVLSNGRVGETYNIGGGVQVTNLALVRNLCSILDEAMPASKHIPHASLIQFVQDRPGHDRRYAMDIGKIGSELGWEPGHTLADGLRATIDWYVHHGDWLAAVHGRSDYATWMETNYKARGENEP